MKIPDDVQKVWREIEESDDLANNALGVSVIRSWLADAAVPLETELETNDEPAAKTPVDIAAESQSEAPWCAPLTREPTMLVGRAATITRDRYGHLMLGNETEAAVLLDGYLDRAHTVHSIAAEAGR